ncbi:MAG: ATP-binding protein [Paludibacteraceae bacterium]|nr:ATP-binding protein [Paludibacteraceae bacterium]
MIRRDLDLFIDNHYANNRSALLLTGARQVGKTFAIRRYAEKHDLNLVEINFYEDENAKNIFDKAKNVKDVLLRLSAYISQPLIKGKTLIFFDEVQHYADVITWIKFLVDEGSYQYALSGSLLGVTLKDIRSMPVGYMAVQEVYPLTLKEFAYAIGVNYDVIEALHRAWLSRQAVDDVVHDSMLRVVTLYLLTGGMPAIVQTYIDTNDIQAVQAKQREILALYRWDIAQYDPNNKLYIDDIFSLIPSELSAKNKRFILKNMNEHRQFSRHENGFIWLRDAGVALPTYNVAEPKTPLKLSENHSLFKLFQNDVGLLAAQYANGIAMQLLNGNININYGAIFENLIAQELKAHSWDLNYYNNKKNGEVDFILEQNGKVVPIEVKSGKDYNRHQALNNLLNTKEYDIDEAIVFGQINLHIKDKVLYAPIYMVMFLDKRQPTDKIIYKPDIDAIR